MKHRGFWGNSSIFTLSGDAKRSIGQLDFLPRLPPSSGMEPEMISRSSTLTALCVCLAGMATLFVGCVGGSQHEDPPTTTELPAQKTSTTAIPVTFTDSRILQYDTGQTDPDVPEAFTSTSSGLRYRILRKSDGRRPGAASPVTVHYRGWLDSGKEFDSSYDGPPAQFRLNQVVAGWSEGLQLIGEGGMIELWVPGRLGYGKSGKGNIPPNATLHFVVELISVNE